MKLIKLLIYSPLAFSLTNPASAISVADAVGNHPCQHAINHQLEQWQASNEVKPSPDSTLQGSAYKISTPVIGRWVLLRKEAKLIHLSKIERKITPNHIEATHINVITWNNDCAITEEEKRLPLSITDQDFNDENLKTVIKNNKMGVIYLWSPHMLLAVDGVNELADITKALGVTYTPLLDPKANIRFANKTVAERGLPQKSLTVARALEFQFRDMYIHSPTLLLYKDGKIIGPSIPGYRSPTHYRQVIKDRFNL